MEAQQQQQRDRVERDRVAAIMREATRSQQRAKSPYADDASKFQSLDHVYFMRGEWTPTKIKELHKVALMPESPLFAGVFRGESGPTERQMRVGQHVAVQNNMVATRMEQFITWMNLADPKARRGSSLGVQRFAAEAFFYLVKIHPFPDANGRVGRLLLMLILKRGGFEPFVLPEDIRLRFNRELDESTETNPERFIMFLEEIIQHYLIQ